MRHRPATVGIALMIGIAVAWSTWAAPSAALRVGIMPFNSPLALLRTHQPLREHLRERLGRPVEMFTSADYFTYINEALAGRFDLLIAGPHVGAMVIDKDYLPLFRYRAVLQPIFVVRRDVKIDSVEDLRGKRIGISSRLAISTIGAMHWLEERGLRMGRDYRIVERTNHGAAVACVAVGDLDAAITAATLLYQIPADVRARLAILPTDIRVPHLMTLAHRRLGAGEIGRIRAALADFSDRSPAGRAFFEETAYLGYEPVSPADIETLKPYVDLTRGSMGLAD